MRGRPDRRGAAAGFTLVEVLVAMLVVALVGAATASTLQQSSGHAGENVLHSQAIVLAQEALEELRTLPFGQVESGSRVSEDGRFTTTWTVADATPEPGMKRIVVTVTWQWKGSERSYTLETIYARLVPD